MSDAECSSLTERRVFVFRRTYMPIAFAIICAAIVGFTIPFIYLFLRVTYSNDKLVFDSQGFSLRKGGYELRSPYSAIGVRESGTESETGWINDWNVQIDLGQSLETVFTLTDTEKKGSWNAGLVEIGPLSFDGKPTTVCRVAYKQHSNDWFALHDIVQIRLVNPIDGATYSDYVDFNNDGKFDLMGKFVREEKQASCVMFNNGWWPITGKFSLEHIDILLTDGSILALYWSGKEWLTLIR